MAVLGVLLTLPGASTLPAQQGTMVLLRGSVVDSQGHPVAGATVTLAEPGAPSVHVSTDAAGDFRLSTPRFASYPLRVDTQDHQHGQLRADGTQTPLRIVVKPLPPMEFADQPEFTVAGITDWTAVGGHGSDATLRTSEDLARGTAALKATDAPEGLAHPSRPGEAEYRAALVCRDQGHFAEAQAHVERALRGGDAADFHRLAGELDEHAGDALGAVREEERAAALEPSEPNLHALGSELLVHRAILEAADVFARGVRLHPESERLRTGWGAALFAEAKYDEAARELCAASDLEPSNRETYVLLGKVALAAPSPDRCAQDRLARFQQRYPADGEANYLAAMVQVKAGDRARAALLFGQVHAADARYAEARLQLGILASAQGKAAAAQADFERAIAADPQLAEAHYRLAVLLDRAGHAAEAKEQFATHARLVKEQADAVERERQAVKQFVMGSAS